MASLTYDVELYHDNVPVSVPARLPQPGNVSAVNEWILENLRDGLYKYAIRAVDASFTGSAVAVGEFSIGTTVQDDNHPLANKFSAVAYPNPAGEQFMIKFDLPSSSVVDIALYDLLGNNLITMPSAKYSEGTHTARLNISTFPRGIYFYKITTKGQSITGKVIAH